MAADYFDFIISMHAVSFFNLVVADELSFYKMPGSILWLLIILIS